MPCYGGGGPSFSVIVQPCEQLVPCLVLAEAAAWLWDRLPPQHTHKHTHIYACCQLFLHRPPKPTLHPSDYLHALIYHCPRLPLLSRLWPRSRAPKITHRSCPVVASAPEAPTHRLICNNHPQGDLMYIVPSTSVVLQSHVKGLVVSGWEKSTFSVLISVFVVSNEVACKDNNAIDLLKKALYIHPCIFFHQNELHSASENK